MSNLPSEPEFEQAYKGMTSYQTRPAYCLRHANHLLTVPHNNRARVNPRELLPLQKEPRIQDCPQGRCHSRKSHTIQSCLGRRQGTGAGQSRIPCAIQLGLRPLQRRSPLSPYGEFVDSQILGVRANL